MAFRLPRRRVLSTGVVAVASAVAIAVTFAASVTVASADPAASPDHPSIADVQKRLGTLALQNAQIVEQYDQAQIDVQRKQAAAVSAERLSLAAEAKFAAARSTLASTVVAQYEGGSFSSTGALLDSANGANYLEQLQTLSMLSSYNADVVTTLTATKREADAAAQQASDALRTAKATEVQLANEKDRVEAQIDKFKSLLSTLNAQQRAAWQRSVAPAAPTHTVDAQKAKFASTPTGVNAAAAQAVKFALAQVGKPYGYGDAGPEYYDCSGLTMAAYASAGISLPHSAAEQYNYGTHVSLDELQPGDLLFYYQPIGHVTMYIGDGMMVSAPETGENILVLPVANMSGFVGATRIVS